MESRVIDVDGVGLHVGVTGQGPDVLVLTGGPGCVQYLEDDAIAPRGFRSYYPEPRGVGRSGGGPHDMERAVADLEALRRALDVEDWIVLGHSWGSDLAVRYAVEHPGSVRAVVGIAGKGTHRDRTWSEAYEAGRAGEPAVDVELAQDVWSSLSESFTEWIHSPGLWRGIADCPVPMQFVAATDDIRPSWPLRQLAALVPHGTFATVPDVPHDFWSTHPDVWVRTVTDACARAAAVVPVPRVRAKVVTLCGSTRFEAEFAEVAQRLTTAGYVVISLGTFRLPDLPDLPDLRRRLGELHLQKVGLADEVYVVDPGGYVGESTRREIAYAESLGTPVRYLSRERPAQAAGARDRAAST